MKSFAYILGAGLALTLAAGCQRGEKVVSETPSEPAAPASNAQPGTAATAAVLQAPATSQPPTQPTPPPMSANTNEVAVISTSEGDMILEFWPDVAPNTVANFIKLAKAGFYDGTCFHRVIKGFMIQGGDPKTKDPNLEPEWGTGDPGYKIKAEFSDRKHVRGVISMARGPHPDSAGCQFFICHGNPSHLDGQYTAFGKLIKGDEVLERIATTPTHPPDRPDKRMHINSIKIVPANTLK